MVNSIDEEWTVICEKHPSIPDYPGIDGLNGAKISIAFAWQTGNIRERLVPIISRY